MGSRVCRLVLVLHFAGFAARMQTCRPAPVSFVKVTSVQPTLVVSVCHPGPVDVAHIQGLLSFFFFRCPPEELVEILETVNPANKAGKVTLITRMSSKHLDEHLPKLILAVQKAGLNVSLGSVRCVVAWCGVGWFHLEFPRFVLGDFFMVGVTPPLWRCFSCPL